MAVNRSRPAFSIVWWSAFTCLIVGLGADNVSVSASATTMASAPTQCDYPTGPAKFIMPIIDKGHRSPQEHLPYAVMLDLFFRGHFDTSAKTIIGESETWYKIHDLHPCLRVDVKLVPDMDNPRLTMQNSRRYFYSEGQEIRTHTAFYSADPFVHFYAGQEADAEHIIHVSPSVEPGVESATNYPNFFRAAPSRSYIFQPMWGFYKLYAWRAVLVIHSMDSRMQSQFEKLLNTMNQWNVPPSYITAASLTTMIPFPAATIFSLIQSLRTKPVRLLFGFLTYGSEHKTKLGISYIDQVLELQMNAGMWLPTYQIVSTREFHQAGIFQNSTVRALIGTSSYGSFFFSESHLLEPTVLAARLPRFSWWMGKAGQLGAIDLNKQNVQETYGLNDWPSSVLQTVLHRSSDEGGLPGLLFSMSTDLARESWFKMDTAMRQLMAHNCFLRGGGNLTVRDAPLFKSCLDSVSQDTKSFAFEMAFDENREMEEIQHLFGPVSTFDLTTNALVQDWWNPVVWSEGPPDYSRATGACVKAGRSTGHSAPVWGNGIQLDDAPKALRNCTPGMTKTDVLGKCEWCQAGRYASQYDAEECIQCSPGKISGAGAAECEECPPGSEARESGSQRCVSCPPGSFSKTVASSTCEFCQLGAFADVRGATACTRCDAKYTTENIASQNETDCVCPRGSYFSENKCISCMKGLACGDGWPQNWAALGGTVVLDESYFSLESAPYEAYVCHAPTQQSDGRCPGGPPSTCSDGLVGLVCNKCSKTGYHIVDGKCEQCSPHLKLVLLFATLAGLLLIVAAFYVTNSPLAVNASHKQDIMVFIGLAITIFQVFGVLKQMQVRWPVVMHDFMGSSSSAFTLDAQAISLTCAVGDDAVIQYLVQAFVPYVLIAMTAALGFTSRVIARACGKAWMAWSVSKCLNVIGQVLQALFIAFCQIMVRPLQCYDHPNDKRSMVMFPEVLCWQSDDHTLLTMIAAGILLFFILPYVAWCVWGCWKAPMKSATKDAAFLECFRFLFYRFRPDCWWWGLIFLVRQTLLAFAAAIPSSNAHAQLFYIGVVLTLYIFFTAMFWPWISTELSIVDFGTSLMLLLILMCSSQFLPNTAEGGRVSLLVIMFIALACVILRYVGIFVMSLCSNNVDEEICGETPNRLDLCQQWFEFIDVMQKQSNKETIATLCKLNTFDRYRVLSFLQGWSAMSAHHKLQLSGGKAPPRLSNIRSRTTLDKDAIGSVGSRVSQLATDSRGLESLSVEDLGYLKNKVEQKSQSP